MVAPRPPESVFGIARQILLRALSIVDVLEARRLRAAEAMREVVDAQRNITTGRPDTPGGALSTLPAATGWVN